MESGADGCLPGPCEAEYNLQNFVALACGVSAFEWHVCGASSALNSGPDGGRLQPEAHETGKPDGVPEIVTLLFVGATASSAPR
ncbi:uncharacterized protein LMH87_007660 [Akanthomyces muscarius]|uniref:Uncharacterized protein n=1 Tax=Akanthomyces muscarius TaxID=2231603 RepID=A0A9W8QM32_AKAMU|nr:uncharacterized protein LMH87_007660 [Akanthomyces muscarius]KAJ4161632.1 hypothetical protein LMH87_007660 [Akanthomyces muscarius]